MVSPGNTSCFSICSPVFMKPGTSKSYSALFTNANWPVLGGSSSSAQTSQSIIWMNECRCQSKALYEDTNNECIQNDKTGRRSGGIYREVTSNRSLGKRRYSTTTVSSQSSILHELTYLNTRSSPIHKRNKRDSSSSAENHDDSNGKLKQRIKVLERHVRNNILTINELKSQIITLALKSK